MYTSYIFYLVSKDKFIGLVVLRLSDSDFPSYNTYLIIAFTFSKSTMGISEQCMKFVQLTITSSATFINFEQISQVILVFP